MPRQGVLQKNQRLLPCHPLWEGELLRVSRAIPKYLQESRLQAMVQVRLPQGLCPSGLGPWLHSKHRKHIHRPILHCGIRLTAPGTHQKRPQMSSDPISEKAARIASALNGLGHIAFGHPLEWARSSKGDAKLREQFHENATIILDLVESDTDSESPATRRPAECKAALSRFRDMMQSVDFDDAASMATLKAYARQALEAFIGETLPETLPK